MRGALGPERSTVAKASTKKETFQITVPQAAEVMLVGDFTEWQEHPIPLKRQKDGVWKAVVSLQPGEHEYRFVVDGEWHDDSDCAFRRTNPFGGENCVRKVSA